MMKKERFDIQGMTCSSCSAHVERAVKKLDGIQKVNVNLLTNNMVVEYDEKILNNEKIINAVINAGYDVSLENEKCLQTENEIKIKKQKINLSNNIDNNLKYMKKRLIISISMIRLMKPVRRSPSHVTDHILSLIRKIRSLVRSRVIICSTISVNS